MSPAPETVGRAAPAGEHTGPSRHEDGHEDGHEPALRVRGLTAGYGELIAARDVSIDVRPGEICLLLGRNGAGKTTVLHAVAGLLPLRSGTIVLAGRDLARAPAHARARAGLALVQENKRVFRRRTVEENLLVSAYSLRRQERRAAIEVAYDRFPLLGQRRKAPAGRLSGGQQQMLAIAQALLPGPRFVLLDEPSAGLAPIIVDEVLRVVRELRDEGMAVLLVEQRVVDVLRIADHVTVLEQGRVARSAPVGEFEDLDSIQALYLGTDGDKEDSER